MSKGISVVVATYNLLPYLKRCVASLLALDYDDYEIIIVNDGSTDGTKEYLAGLTDGRLKAIDQEKNAGTCLARNRGLEAARYPIIAFLDHDCLAEQSWLANLAAAFEQEDIDFVFGQVFYVAKNYHGYFPERLVRNIGAWWPMGCNLAIRQAVLTRLGGFDPAFFPYGNEDTEIALRAIGHGLKYARAPDAVVYHQAINWNVKSLWRSARYASVWPVLKKKYPRDYRHFGPRILWGVIAEPKDYLFILFSPILIPVLFIRYLIHGKRDLKVFFAKWPIWFLLRRFYLWREAIKRGVFMV